MRRRDATVRDVNNTLIEARLTCGVGFVPLLIRNATSQDDSAPDKAAHRNAVTVAAARDLYSVLAIGPLLRVKTS